MNQIDLKGRHAVITGGAQGIGFAIVSRLLASGASVSIWDRDEQVIAEAATSEEEILVVECDPHRMEEVRRGWPFLRDRRIDAYAPILKRWLD